MPIIKKLFLHLRFPALSVPAIACLLLACHSPSWAQPASVKEPKVTALIPRDVPPTYYQDKKTGEPAGFAVEVMNKIAKRAGIQVEYRYGDNWADIFSRMKRGEADIVPDFGITEERKKILAYGPPLEAFQISFFVRAKRGGHEELEESAHVGVMSGSIPNTVLAARPSLRLVAYESYQHAFFDLITGRIDAVAGPIPTILTLARESGLEDKIREVGPPFSEIKRAIAVRKDNIQLLARLNKATEAFVETPEFQHLYVKWYGKPVSFWTARRIMTASSSLLVLIVSAMVFWRYRSMLRLNRELTKNITERKQAEEALRLSEERYRGIVESQTEFIVRYRPGGILTYVNNALAKYSAMEHADLRDKSLYPFIHENDRELVIKAIESMTKSNPIITIENRVTRPDGKPGWHQWNHRAILDANGKIIEYQAVGRDITERKSAEEALRANKDFIERMLDTVDEGFIVIDRDYRIIQANRAFCKQAGMPLQEVIGKHCYEISHRKDKPCFLDGEDCAVRDCFEKGHAFTYVHKHYRGDGSLIYTETKSYPLNSDSGKISSVIEVINDITDKHLMEEQLQRTQKMEAIGLLAGGIAHDFNNLLQGVFGNISVAKTFVNKEEDVYQMLEDAESALAQATNLTRQLLTFSRGGAPVKKVIALGPAIRNAVKFALSGSALNCSVSITENLAPVEADEGQLGQVIGNILLNAREAMPNGGTITLTAQNVLLDEKSGLPLQRGKYIRIMVEDTGHGIPASSISKIFDPYFTTKQMGNGLGLATAHSIINKHGGVIHVVSRLGIGSTFSIYLPASKETVPTGKSEDQTLLPGRGRILVMDDEDVVRGVAGKMLRRLGYEVDFSENGEQATEKYSTALGTDRPFTAVILDLTVPGGMGGSAAMKKMLEIDPKVKGIVSSGYSDNNILSNYRDYGFAAFLSKPYKAEELSKILHTVINHSNF